MGVSRASALSMRRRRRISAREVNMRYGSSTPFESGRRSGCLCRLRRAEARRAQCFIVHAALMPAISPWHPASSYPEVPFTCPARNRRSIDSQQTVVEFARSMASYSMAYPVE
jgi:hypothetical protein